jgi:hypothetical protein
MRTLVHQDYLYQQVEAINTEPSKAKYDLNTDIYIIQPSLQPSQLKVKFWKSGSVRKKRRGWDLNPR